MKHAFRNMIYMSSANLQCFGKPKRIHEHVLLRQADALTCLNYFGKPKSVQNRTFTEPMLSLVILLFFMRRVVAAELEPPAKADDETPMGNWLLDKFKKRKLTTPDFVEGCHAEVSSSSTQGSQLIADTSRLAGKQNLSRVVKKILNKKVDILEPYEADIPLWDRIDCKQVTRPMLFMNIHEVLEYEHIKNPDVDFCSFSPDQTKFEETLQSTCDRLGCDREGTAGLAIWGDYAKYHTRDSIALMLWSFLSGPIRKRFWICGFAKRQGCGCGCGQRHTIDAIFSVIGWMLRVVLSGVWPTFRHDGVAFADSDRPGDKARAKLAGKKLPFRALIQKKCADWSWFKGALSLQGWSVGQGNHRTCFKCCANCGDTPWTDPSMWAKWRKTIITDMVFWSWVFFGGTVASPIFAWPGFRYDMLDADWMHTVDLGVTLVVLGNIFLDFFYHLGGTHREPKQALGLLMSMIKVASKAKDTEPPIWDLTMGMIASSASEYPVMKLKAGEARYMVPICFYMAAIFFPASSDYELLRLNMFQQLVRCYELLDNFDGEKMGFHARAFGMLYNQLNRGALADNPQSVRWRLYPKFHLMQHLCETNENPRHSWNYMEESAIGEAAITAEACDPAHMHRSLIQNYRLFEFRKP